MGCGQKAWADEQEEERLKEYKKECISFVGKFESQELGNLLFDIRRYFRYLIEDGRMKRQQFGEIDALLERMSKE